MEYEQCEAAVWVARDRHFRQCMKNAHHWTHEEGLGGSRMALCSSHYRMVERAQGTNTDESLVGAWRELGRGKLA